MYDTTVGGKKLRCPFYSVADMGGALLASHCNQCALVGMYRPCELEMKGELPQWNACPRKAAMSDEELAQWRTRKVVGLGRGEQDEPFAARFDRLVRRST